MFDKCDAASTDSTSEPTMKTRAEMEKDGLIFEYTSAANPDMAPVPILGLASETHEKGATRIIPFDLSKELKVDYAATSPNLMASFIRINPGESISSNAVATSQAFYVIRGEGCSWSQHGEVKWAEGDLFVLPACKEEVKHSASKDSALYWVTDEPLMNYLGVIPSRERFAPTLFTKERMMKEVEKISHAPGANHKNRLGILLGNKNFESSTKTLTHTLWSLLNMLPGKEDQRPHRHNSVALDLCVGMSPDAVKNKSVYTLMGPELDEDGWVKNPVRCNWMPGAVFVTPPGWWHSHHNESGEPAWVLPVQDAGLHTYNRTLDITFSKGSQPFPPRKKQKLTH
eukprot:g35908.t1